MERMVNQNDSHDIIDDYKYWEDQSDQFKDDGNLLPLWKFYTDRVKKREVTCIAWNPLYTDLFAVGYGSYEFLKQGNGAIQCFTLKNAFPTASQGPNVPAFPEFYFQLDSGVISIDFHPTQPALPPSSPRSTSIIILPFPQTMSAGRDGEDVAICDEDRDKDASEEEIARYFWQSRDAGPLSANEDAAGEAVGADRYEVFAVAAVLKKYCKGPYMDDDLRAAAKFIIDKNLLIESPENLRGQIDAFT